MIAGYGGDTEACRELPLRELEETFWYPGPQDYRTLPGAATAEHWERAKETCLNCPVYLRCRSTSWGERHGIWGGTDPHERYRHRQNLGRAHKKLPLDQRAAVEAELYAQMSTVSAQELARRTGYHVDLLRGVKERYDRVAGQQRDARRFVQSARVAALPDRGREPEFPEEKPPLGDCWVWWRGRAAEAHYVAETPDGAWVLVKFRASKGQPTKKWAAREDIQSYRKGQPVFAERKKAAA